MAERKPTRIRRTAEDARAAILDATEKQLAALGPQGVRLQDVAAEVGITHSTILHHFGSREQLIAEVVQRCVAAMNAEVLAAVAAGPTDDVIGDVLDRLFSVFDAGGHARVVAFMALEGRENPVADGVKPLMVALRGLVKDPAQAELLVLLVTYALFGEAIAGPTFRAEPPGQPDFAARRRFLEGLKGFVRAAVAPGLVVEAEADGLRSGGGPRGEREGRG